MSPRHSRIAPWRSTHARHIRAERLESRLVFSTITWDGAADDEGDPQAGDGHTFFDPWNWDANQVPGASDVARISAAGPIDYLGDATLAALECQNDFRLQGGTLELVGSSWVDGDLLMAGGTLIEPQTLAVFGAFHWTGGKLTGGGRIELQTGGTIDAAAAKSLDNVTLDNRGLLVWSGSGPIRAANGAILQNELGAEFQFQSDAALDYEFGLPPAIDNAGLVRKTAGAGASPLGAAFNNTGTLQVEVGDVTLAGGGANQGTFQIAELASVHVGLGNLQLDAGSQIVGGGELIVGGDGTLAVPSGVDVPVDTLALTPGSGGITGLGTLTVVHAMRWTGGRMDSAGITSIAPGATLEIGGPGAKQLDRRTLVNRGQAVWWGGGPLGASNGALIDNRDNAVAPPGRWEIADDSLLIHTAGPQPVLRNSGLLVTTAAAADLVSFAYLDNQAVGAILISGGGIALHGGGGSTGPIEIAAGGSLRVEGEAFTLSAGASQIGPGAIVVGGAGTLDVPAGANVSIETLTLNPGSGGLDGGGTITIAGAMNWTGGRLAGFGATAIAPGATLVVSGTATKTLDGRTLTNRGYVLWSGTGAIDVANGAAIANLPNPITPHGTWEIATAASLNYAAGAPPSFQNSGIVHATNLGQSTTVGINVVNAGQVLVDAGAALTLNAAFTQTGGATMTDGMLLASEGLAIDGGAIGGSGTIGGSLVNAGQLSIGASPGRLTVSGPLVQGPTASLAIDLAGEVAGAEYDQLVVGGPVTLDGALSVSRSFTPAIGTTFVVLDNLGSDPIGGTFDGLPEGQSLVVAGQPLVISYKGGTGNDVVLVAQAPPGNSVVSTALDSGPGSLRQAIADANAAAGANTIIFAIPGEGPHAINLASALPSLVEAVTLDVPAGASVEVGGASAFGFPDFATLTKIGAGTIVFSGGDVRINGEALASDAGHFEFRDAGAGLLVLDSLAVSPGATLDLNDSDLVIHATAATRDAVLAGVTDLLTSGAAGLAWNGPGIASSVAAGDPNLLTGLGVMLNDNGLGGGYYASFSGEPVDANSVLVKYTYYGDADLSGSVDGTDYALVDNGFNAALAGWFNGDFDYSATTDGTDYALIDNAFNSQSLPLASLGPIPRAAGRPNNSLTIVGGAGEGGGAAEKPALFTRAAHDRVLADWNADGIDLDGLAILSAGSRRRRAAR